MLERQVTICNKLGLHARASAKLVGCVSHYASDIRLCKDQQEVNAKSIMGIMMLAASNGTRLTIKVDGDDEIEAMQTLVELIESKFQEEEFSQPLFAEKQR